jgi:predicted amino acid-binding ACT domain protein
MTQYGLSLMQVRPTCDGSFNSSSSTKGGNAIEHDSCESLHPPPAFGSSSNFELAFEGNKSDAQYGNRPLHEITISTKDKPKLLSELTCLMSEIGLNIQEAHAFCTIDGYSLDVFVVDSWEKGIDHLKNILVKEIPKIEKRLVIKQESVSPVGGQSSGGFMLPPSHVEVPDGGDVWEIDTDLLTFEYKIAAGINGDMYKGLFRDQDVAIKIFKTECLNGDMQREFAQEVFILRKVRHKNIVQFIGACTRPPLLCVVTEFMPGGSVYDFLHKRKCVFKLPAILKIAIDVSKGMSYLHQHNIIHRDLKAANLLMDENEGLRPTIPRHTHPLLVELLERCWQQEPSSRPEFSEVTEMLQYMAGKILEEERASKKRNLGERRQLMGEWPSKIEGNENAA